MFKSFILTSFFNLGEQFLDCQRPILELLHSLDDDAHRILQILCKEFRVKVVNIG